MQSQRPAGLVVVTAGLCGAAGVALAAVAAHRVPDPALAGASHLLILHAAAALALATFSRTASAPRLVIAAAALLLAGSGLFTADIAWRAFFADRLFPMAAPAGGSTMITGWLAAGLAGAAELRRSAK